MKSIIKKIAMRLGIEIKRVAVSEGACISLKPQGTPKGDILLSYSFGRFLSKDVAPLGTRHICDWECWQIARTFLGFGYCVDVISYDNHTFKPAKEYSFCIDTLTNLERIAPLLGKGCVKILHIIWAHWLFHNHANYGRHLALQQRKGLVLKPRKILAPNLGIECADCATMTGNEFTAGTYRYAQKPIYRVPAATVANYPWMVDKDYNSCRNHFLWLGGSGLVHKGLDLVLDAFAEMPDYHLTVCGPIRKDKAFEAAFYRELYQTTNIQSIGLVDISSPAFIEIARNCVGLIHPSCAEGQSGAVLTGLHAGLIPIVSVESGVDVDGFGIILGSSSIEDIKNSIRMVANLPAQELKLMSRNAWEFARANHTKEKFAAEYRKAVAKIGHVID